MTNNSRVAAIVPYRGGNGAKSRLTNLSPGERAHLGLALLRRVMAAVEGVLGLEAVVVSPEDVEGFKILKDSGRGLNEAVELGLHWADCRGADIALVIPADLPFLTTADVAELLALVPKRGGVVAYSKDGGTGALALRPPRLIRPEFGPSSGSRHLVRIEMAGGETRSVKWPGFETDIDGPEDLEVYGAGLLSAT